MAKRDPKIQPVSQYVADWGVYSGATTLPNAALRPIRGEAFATLRIGDRAIIGTTTWSCQFVGTAGGGDAVWAALGASASGGSGRSYGDTTLVLPNIVGAGSVTPTTMADANEKTGGNILILSFFDTIYKYTKTTIKVIDPATSTVVFTDTLTFASVTALATWINNNVNKTHVVTMSSTDLVDVSVPIPAKVYGKNRLWASLTHGERYWSPRVRSAVATDSQSPAAKAVLAQGLYDLTTQLVGSPSSPSASWGFKDFAVYWMTGYNRRTRYDMPSVKSFEIQNTGVYSLAERYALDTGGNLTSIDTNPNPPARFAANGKVAYLGIDAACTSSVVLNLRSAMSDTPYNLGDYILGGYSFVCGYLMYDSTNKWYSIYLKPVGVDQLFFDAFDDTKYRLESIVDPRNDLRPNIVEMQTTLQMPERRTTNAFDMSFMRIGSRVQRVTYHPGRHSVTTGSARFQLRDLLTGLVSPLSSARIRTVERQRHLPFALKVESHNEV